jgi:surfeit locus 1 family protein
MSYRFQPRLLPTLATLILVAICIKLGLWQQHKAQLKQDLQAELEQRLHEPPAALPKEITDPANWRYRRVSLNGIYAPEYQILLDNQVHHDVAGYHVVTPLLINGGTSQILVDRGWIAAPADRRTLPNFDTPSGVQRVEGYLWLPGKYFSLEPPSTKTPVTWQVIWQNMDMARYAASVPFAVYPLVIRLDAASGAGGFIREWPLPAERVEMHIGYAFQWFGFALALVVIFIVVNFKRTQH